MTARTETAIPDVEKFLDLLETKADALSALDEPEPLNSIVVEGAVTGCGPIRRAVSKLAARVGLTADTIRYYERAGLLP